MASTTQFPPHTANGHSAPQRRRWTRGRIAVAAWITIVIGFWIYAFFFAPKGSPDILDDRLCARGRDSLCSSTHRDPRAAQSEHREDRRPNADVIDRANQELRDMLADDFAAADGHRTTRT